jgi:hypothetical protein
MVANTTPNRSQHPRAPKSIGLWGAPQSGKTTYLAALYFAVARSSIDLNIVGVNDDSTDFMVSSSNTLSKKHKFPDGTITVSSYSWIMNMTTQVQVPQRGTFGRQSLITVPQHRQFNIDLRDAPGGHFGMQQSPSGAPTPSRVAYAGGNPAGGASQSPVSDIDDLMDYLAGCDGLLLLIDPVRELELGDSHEYFQATLLKIAQRRLANMPPGSKLPHYIAVCITKFDDPTVYKFARLNGYRSYDEDDPYLFPRVHDDDAEIFFKELCGNSAVGDADLICSALTRYFQPERIRYFVTSAIGFYRNGARFRDDDYRNIVDQSGGSYEIRGQIHPINVLQPMLWLGRCVTAVNGA